MQYRRIRSEESTVGPTVLIGLGLGLAAGFLLGELYGREGRRRLGRLWRRWKRAAPPAPAQDLTIRIHQILTPILGDDAESLHLIAVGREGLELHGWVSSRRARARTLDICRKIVGPDRQLVDRLLVWGEDDAPPPNFIAVVER